MSPRDTAWRQLKWATRVAAEPFFGPRPLSPADDRPLPAGPEEVLIRWPSDVPRPCVGLVKDVDRPPYWTKFQRFLENNQIPFDYYDPHLSNWFETALRFDAIVWRLESPPAKVEQARRKIYLLETRGGRLCYPRFFSAQHYEDKIVQWELLKAAGFPVIDTFYSTSYSETVDYLSSTTYPLVSKLVTGSASRGVAKLRDARSALEHVKRVFSLRGAPTYWPHLRQQGYVLLQPLVPNAGYDLRVLVIGERAFGYYRDAPAGDFRASGNADSRKEALPHDAMETAHAVAAALDQEMLAVDFLRRTDGGLGIIEMSAFIRVDTPRQLEIDGVPGAYERLVNGGYEFKPGEFWPQELALAEFFTRRWFPRHGTGAAGVDR